MQRSFCMTFLLCKNDRVATICPLPILVMKKSAFSILLLPFLFNSCTTPVAPDPNATVPPAQDLSVAYGTAQTYAGSVGSRSAIFTLTWIPDGNVTGSYYHPADGAIYQLRGKNTSDGQLVLTETTAGIQSAIITLKKSITGGLITWTGTMHNTDGRVIPVSFTRRGV